jgi:hypothetical protein
MHLKSNKNLFCTGGTTDTTASIPIMHAANHGFQLSLLPLA